MLNIATTATIGLLNGSIIRKNADSSEQPSNLAASMYDIEIPLKKFLNRKILNALVPAIIQRGKYPPSRLTCRIGTSAKLIYNGTILIPGNIIDQNISVSNTTEPFGFTLDKTYPAIPFKNISKAKHPIIRLNVLNIYFPKLTFEII